MAPSLLSIARRSLRCFERIFCWSPAFMSSLIFLLISFSLFCSISFCSCSARLICNEISIATKRFSSNELSRGESKLLQAPNKKSASRATSLAYKIPRKSDFSFLLVKVKSRQRGRRTTRDYSFSTLLGGI